MKKDLFPSIRYQNDFFFNMAAIFLSHYLLGPYKKTSIWEWHDIGEEDFENYCEIYLIGESIPEIITTGCQRGAKLIYIRNVDEFSKLIEDLIPYNRCFSRERNNIINKKCQEFIRFWKEKNDPEFSDDWMTLYLEQGDHGISERLQTLIS